MRPPCPNRHRCRTRGANCATDPVVQTEAATAEVKLLQSRQRPAASPTLRQPRRHYAAPASSDDAQIAPADNDLRRLPQGTAPSDGLTARQNRRPCNAICTRPLPAGNVSRAQSGAPRALGQGLNPMDRLATAKRHRCQCRVPRRPPDSSAQAGVVSRVPCSSRNAQAFGTDRNTYLTSTHQR